MSKFNSKFVAEIFDRLLSGENAEADEQDLSQIFEFFATRLFSEFPSRNGQYFDGVVGLESKKVERQKIEFQGEMWVGADKRQWTEPFQATITDMRITKQGFRIIIQIGKDRTTGEVLSLFDASQKFGEAVNTKRAFTLVELLVVIAIIGILAALLLAGLSGTKLRAQRIACLNNVKQLSLGSFMYAQDNSRHAGYDTSAFPGGNWMGTLNEYASAKGILICPCAPVQEPPPASGNEQGYADRAWVRWTSDKKTMFAGSYGYNGWLYSDLQPSEKGDPGLYLIFRSEAAVQKPSLTPVFFDENWVDAWPKETDLPYTNLYTGQPLGVSPNQMGRCTIARHGNRSASGAPRNFPTSAKMPGAINMGLADGHTELAKLEDLWKYYWHLDWQPPAARPQ